MDSKTETEIKERLDWIQSRQQYLSEARREMSLKMAADIGTDEIIGISIDPLTKWARRIRKINTEMKDLADERRELRAKRRVINPCTCNCHQS